MTIDKELLASEKELLVRLKNHYEDFTDCAHEITKFGVNIILPRLTKLMNEKKQKNLNSNTLSELDKEEEFLEEICKYLSSSHNKFWNFANDFLNTIYKIEDYFKALEKEDK